MFLGLDASTQSLSAVIIDPSAGRITHRESISFGQDLPQFGCPNGFLPGGANGEVHADPRMWLEALDQLMSRLAGSLDLSTIRGIAGSGQQHGSVYLDDSFPLRLSALNPQASLVEQLAPCLTRATAPIWMDTSTTGQCDAITRSAGGRQEIISRSGSPATERFTGPQIRRFFETQPDAWQRTARIHLVSSFIASILAGRDAAIDPGDGAGMNLMNLNSGDWDPLLLEATAPDLAKRLPPIRPSLSDAGGISPYFVQKFGFAPSCRIGLFTGDNPASLVGMGATTPGRVVISLGTSDTCFAATPSPCPDPAGLGHVFGNPAGGYLSLFCFRNGSLAREALKQEYQLSWDDFDEAALAKTHSLAGQNLMLPFYAPEITPRLDLHQPLRRGDAAFVNGSTPDSQVRALLEGQFLNMRLHTQGLTARPDSILLTGGASKNQGIAQMVANVFQAPVERLDLGDSAALGAALMAAAGAGADNLENLQARFCQTSAGGPPLTPDSSLAAPYSDALQRFAALLAEAASAAKD